MKLNSKQFEILAKQDYRKLNNSKLDWDSFLAAYIIAYDKGYVHAFNYDRGLEQRREQTQ